VFVGNPGAEGAAELIGVASVIDGDTLELHGQRIRLYGIDAFESAQRCVDTAGASVRCGRLSAMALDELVSGRTLRCTPVDRDRYDRIVARCRTLDTADLGAAMVAQGWAIAYRRFSQRYITQERAAEAARAGAWALAFDAPSDWRAGRRAATT
jgi:endonuclease YncB( thermonuclease family)